MQVLVFLLQVMCFLGPILVVNITMVFYKDGLACTGGMGVSLFSWLQPFVFLLH
jgi:hypothetical protein